MSSLNLLDLRLKLSNSTNYQRLTLLIFGLCSYFLLISSLVIFLKLGLSLLILLSYLKIQKNPRPVPKVVSLNYKSKLWQLEFADGRTFPFEKHKILLELGIFFLLELSSPNERRLLPIFFDQISAESYRKLRLLETVL